MRFLQGRIGLSVGVVCAYFGGGFGERIAVDPMVAHVCDVDFSVGNMAISIENLL